MCMSRNTSVCEGVLSVLVVFDLNCTSLITEERDSVSKTVRVSQRHRKTTTASPVRYVCVHACLCVSVCVCEVCLCVHVFL